MMNDMTPGGSICGQIEYELVRPLAEGGMGVVYEARQKGAGGFEKVVAIKIIREEFSSIPEFRNNFVGEARLVSDLIHRNIVQTYHLGESGNQYYMVMEMVSGVNLEEFILQHRYLEIPIPLEMAVFVVSRICRGLAYAHAKRDRNNELLNIVHRDVNPRNIMLSYEGDVKLTDFGIAKALNLMYNKEGDVIAGKDEYLSPEQARREVTDGRADLFCCGILLEEMILGRNIFEAPKPEATRKRILNLELPDFRELRDEVDDALDEILRKALERDRDKRYQNAGDMLLALEIYLYSDHYGPTDEKLAAYLAEIFAPGRPFWENSQYSSYAGFRDRASAGG